MSFNQAILTNAVRTALVTGNYSAWTPSGASVVNLKKLTQALVNGSRVTSLLLSTTDTISGGNNVVIILDSGNAGLTSILGIVNVPVGSGVTANIPTVDALSPLILAGLPRDQFGKQYIHLGPSDTLWIGTIANMTGGTTLFASAMIEDYPTS